MLREGVAEIWAWAALQREVGTIGRGSSGGRAHLGQALIQLRGEAPWSSRTAAKPG